MADEDDIRYTLTEFCVQTNLSETVVRELVGEGVVEPQVTRNYWYFSTREIGQIQRAVRLMQDLELTAHGAALALELMEHNHRLRRRIAYLEQLVSRLSS